MCTCDMHKLQDRAGHYTIARWSGREPTMLASSVQAVVACNATAPRGYLVLFIIDLSKDCIYCCLIIPNIYRQSK